MLKALCSGFTPEGVLGITGNVEDQTHVRSMQDKYPTLCPASLVPIGVQLSPPWLVVFLEALSGSPWVGTPCSQSRCKLLTAHSLRHPNLIWGLDGNMFSQRLLSNCNSLILSNVETRHFHGN